jgi:polyhydroxybutyrate depolymerase
MAPTIDCAEGSRLGPPGGEDGDLTAMGVNFNVRVPADYQATVAHPLIVVYSPAGVTDPLQTEQFTGLTPDALARGYLVAYPNHRSPQSQQVVLDLGTVASLVAQRWCIDEQRIFFTGHSDGGSVASLLPLYGTTPPPRAIAPSAAGVNQGFVDQATCPLTPVSAMVIHSAGDTLFPLPEFGEPAADFWASCGACGMQGAALPDGCVPYDGCPSGLEVQYCQTVGAHGMWYGLNAAMLDFFDRAGSLAQ